MSLMGMRDIRITVMRSRMDPKRDFLGGPVVKTLHREHGFDVQSLARELRSHIPHAAWHSQEKNGSREWFLWCR